MPLFQVFEFAFVCCSIAAVALLLWDHVVTFGDEVSKIWSKKISGGTVLYALLRYGTAAEKITVMLLASWYMTPQGCNIVVRIQIFPMILRTLAFSLFSSLRVYALMERDWRLAVFVALLFLPSVITPAYSYAHQWSPAVDRYGCQLAYLASQPAHDHMRIAGIVADILSETIVIIVTLKKTFSLRNNNKSETSGSDLPSLSRLLLRDGTLYFGALLVLSLADMLVLIFDHVPQSVVGYDYWVVPYYTPVFRTIIICRFLLQLRAAYFIETNEEKSLASLDFASRIVGNLGATVDEGEGDMDDEDIIYSRDPFATGLMVMEASTREEEDEMSLP